MRSSFTSRTLFSLVAGALVSTGCYHAVVDTGLKPGATTIDRPWAHGFVYGLVPPNVLETAAKCPNGAAKIETQHSFLNMLAGALTWGIYTPMQINVTCAEKTSVANGGAGVSGRDTASVVAQAAERSARTGEPVFVEIAQ